MAENNSTYGLQEYGEQNPSVSEGNRQGADSSAGSMQLHSYHPEPYAGRSAGQGIYRNTVQNTAAAEAPRKRASSVKILIFALIISIAAGTVSGYFGTYIALGGSRPTVLWRSADPNSGISTEEDRSIADVVQMTQNSVVEITAERRTGSDTTGRSWGSGVIISSDGYIVTNCHVVTDDNNKKADKVSVLVRGYDAPFTAIIVATDEKTDLAVLKINQTGLTPAVMGDSDTLMVGQKTIVIGNPLGQLGGSVTDGIISALDREISVKGQYMRLLQTNAAVNPGNSGGGLFNLKGQLIGIVNAKTMGVEVEGLAFAIPVNSVKEVTEQLITHGYVQGRVETGMDLIDITDRRTQVSYGVDRNGVYVLNVKAGSNAEKAGIAKGDIIVNINDAPVSSLTDINKRLLDAKVGDVWNIKVERGSRAETFSVTLSEYFPGNE